MARKRGGSLGHSGRLSSVGLELALTVVGSLLLGWWLDGQLGTEPWLAMVGVFFGFGVAFLNLFRTLQRHEAARERNGD